MVIVWNAYWDAKNVMNDFNVKFVFLDFILMELDAKFVQFLDAQNAPVVQSVLNVNLDLV